MKITVLIGRILFSLIFLNSGIFAHLIMMQGTIGYAASAGVPMPNVLVPLSGIIAILGALSILLGYKAKLGAWLIIIFLIPVTLMMHSFWNVSDPMMHGMQMAMFMKNISLFGTALILTYFGAGPYSFDAMKKSE